MNKRQHINAFALPFHLEKTKSHEILIVRPLSKFLSFSFRPWDGIHLPTLDDKKEPLLFFQYPPPQELLENKNFRMVWIPMLDHIRKYSRNWWYKLPKSLKVVAFSNFVAEIAKEVGLETLQLRYYTNPKEMKRVRWNKGINLFYWNRIGLIARDDLSRLCTVLNVKTLYFQNQLDPGILKSLQYFLPSKLGETQVVQLNDYLPRREYVKILEESNIYIAPRLYEGVGISFIEALARGCFVIGINHPTMNEYIVHKKNGYLFNDNTDNFFKSLVNRAIRIRIPKFIGGQSSLISLSADLNDLAKIDLESIGDTAYLKNKEGFSNWQKELKTYADFITSRADYYRSQFYS